MPGSSIVLPMLWQSALLPFAVALAVLFAGRALRLQAAASVLAVAAGFLASYFAALHAQWSPVPKVALDWLPWTVVVAAAAALPIETRDGFARILARGVVALIAAALVVWPALASFGAAKAAIAIVVTAALVTLVWSLLAASNRGKAVQPFLLAVVAGGAGLALMLDSSQSAGRLSGALAMTLAACLLFAWPRLRVAFAPAATGVVVVLLGALLANAHLYAGFPPSYLALLVGALLAQPVLDALLHRARAPVGWAWLPSAVLTVVPVLVTVALAVKAASDSGGY
ncbi:MAG TPA: hypothetical protein VF522_15170 [Ramlibacter sp.]|uniref:hypothetical protein n=1 Tax=Ramlibacter sp. TaxID=1917967 RepID=UPI002ED20273